MKKEKLTPQERMEKTLEHLKVLNKKLPKKVENKFKKKIKELNKGE